MKGHDCLLFRIEYKEGCKTHWCKLVYFIEILKIERYRIIMIKMSDNHKVIWINTPCTFRSNKRSCIHNSYGYTHLYISFFFLFVFANCLIIRTVLIHYS